MTTLVLYFVLALGTSFVCSLLEAVTLSLTYAYIAALEPRRPRSAVLLTPSRQQEENYHFFGLHSSLDIGFQTDIKI